MHIYFSGILGAGISALANLALDLGFVVSGSDPAFDQIYQNISQNPTAEKLLSRGVNISPRQDFEHIQSVFESSQKSNPITWFVHTAAIKSDHPELVFVKDLQKSLKQEDSSDSDVSDKDGFDSSIDSQDSQSGSDGKFQNIFHIGKRDEFLNWLIKYKNLKMVAIAGTHGKTTTTAMLVWLFKSLKVPISYLVGSEISFGYSAHFDSKSRYFVFECDEFDRNFLHFYPEIAVIPSLDYDHQDIYPTQADYYQAFVDFFGQVKNHLILSPSVPLKSFCDDFGFESGHGAAKNLKISNSFDDQQILKSIKLPGLHNRQNAELILFACLLVLQDLFKSGELKPEDIKQNPSLENLSDLDNSLNSNLDHDLNHTIELIKNLNPSESISDLIKIYQSLGIFEIISAFPGSRRRFEKISPDYLLYSDYAHHPSEIASIIKMAKEILC